MLLKSLKNIALYVGIPIAIALIFYQPVWVFLTGPTKASPDLIRFKSFPKALGLRPLEFPFSIINKTDDNLYDVWVRLTPLCNSSETADEVCSKIVIEPTGFDEKFFKPLKTRYACTNYIRVDGYDADGVRSVWLVSYTLEANGKNSFALKLEEESVKSVEGDELKIRVETYGGVFEKGPKKTPPPFSDIETVPGKGAVCWCFKPPEDMKHAKATPVFLTMSPKKEERREQSSARRTGPEAD